MRLDDQLVDPAREQLDHDDASRIVIAMPGGQTCAKQAWHGWT